ncbi:MAG TPA: PLDc N-terminal domain-containing protein [Chthoniobacteraceae bacterium]|nr:PLDc N-terminal domain-containing protein [Chthoniobacteraceae bacterium]
MIPLILGLVATIFWIWMLVDAVTSSLAGTEKIVWVLVIVFLHVLGAVLYYFIARKPRAIS